VLTGYLCGSLVYIRRARDCGEWQDLREFECLQHRGVQDTKDSNSVVLAADVELDSCRVALEESGVYEIC
jgi:hypothetical protein